MKKMGKRGMAAIAVFLATSLGACSLESQEPAPRTPLGTVDYVHIMVAKDSTEAMVLGKLYETALDQRGRATSLRVAPGGQDRALHDLRSGGTDLVIGCAGDSLEFYDPELAEQLADEFDSKSDEDLAAGEGRDQVYEALLASLPGSLTATDPSNAQACEGSNELPQNIVPIYRKPNMAREHREVLNWVSGAISTEEIQELVTEVDQTGAVTASVEEFLSNKGF